MAKKIKLLEYIVRYVVPNKLKNHVHFSFNTIRCQDEPSAKRVYELITTELVREIKETHGEDVMVNEIDITMISLVNTSYE